MIEPYWTSDDGRHRLFCADSRTLMAKAGAMDASVIVSDPPYGIGYEASRYQMAKQNETFSGVIEGDKDEFDPTHLIGLKVSTILWGGNNFAHRLPAGGWLCWDKRVSEAADRILGSPFELAWCSIRTKFKMIRCLHGGVVNADGHGIKRVHPTQKPIRVLQWCLTDVLRLKADSLVLDPYCGSGTTGVACIREGHRFVGIEIEEKYCKVAVERLERELAQPSLFANVKEGA